jgi:hypothetical protein
MTPSGGHHPTPPRRRPLRRRDIAGQPSNCLARSYRPYALSYRPYGVPTAGFINRLLVETWDRASNWRQTLTDPLGRTPGAGARIVRPRRNSRPSVLRVAAPILRHWSPEKTPGWAAAAQWSTTCARSDGAIREMRAPLPSPMTRRGIWCEPVWPTVRLCCEQGKKQGLTQMQQG